MDLYDILERLVPQRSTTSLQLKADKLEKRIAIAQKRLDLMKWQLADKKLQDEARRLK